MSATRLAPVPGPQRTAELIAERLFMLSGQFGAHRATGCTLRAEDVCNLMTVLDDAAADATRLAEEIGELTDMIVDFAEGEPSRPKKGPPQLTVIESDGRC